jgi:DNA-binding NarL/FixJ family response regulator
METIKIILADDHKLIRDGIKTLLKKNDRYEIIAEADNGKHLMEILEQYAPDIILIDITMPYLNGIDAIAQLKKVNPNFKFIVLTMHEEAEYILKSIQSGASGYLLKNAEYEELQEAINVVAAGGKYFNNNISNLIIENLTRPSAEKVKDYQDLTAREIEILREVADGLSTKLIADKLSISSRTVETHRVNIMKKLEAHNTAELIKKALDRKII